MSGAGEDDRPYEVGYGKPPTAARFKPGRSGNPRGRPKGARGVARLLSDTLAQKITVTEGGQSRRISKLEALILSLVTKAIKGDVRAMAPLLKLIQAYEGTSEREDDRGLTINVIDSFNHDPE